MSHLHWSFWFSSLYTLTRLFLYKWQLCSSNSSVWGLWTPPSCVSFLTRDGEIGSKCWSMFWLWPRLLFSITAYLICSLSCFNSPPTVSPPPHANNQVSFNVLITGFPFPPPGYFMSVKLKVTFAVMPNLSSMTGPDCLCSLQEHSQRQTRPRGALPRQRPDPQHFLTWICSYPTSSNL